MKLLEKLNYYMYFLAMLGTGSVYARSVKGVARRVSKDAKDLSVELLLVGILVVGALFALGSRNATEKAVGWGKGALFIFGGTTIIGFVKGWF